MIKGFFFLLISMFIVILAACGGQSSQTNGRNSYNQVSSEKADNGKQTSSSSSGEKATKIQLLKNDTVGNYLADDKGMTLYYYTKDDPEVSNCTGGCLQNWPAFYKDVNHLQLPTGFNKTDFGSITRDDTGKQQITYKGYPLYYYIPDQQKGDVKGQGVGGVWYIVNANTMLNKGQVGSKTNHADNNGY